MNGESHSQPNSVRGLNAVHMCFHILYISYMFHTVSCMEYVPTFPPQMPPHIYPNLHKGTASVSLELRSTWNNQIFSPSPSCGPWKAGGWRGSPEIVDSSAKIGDLAKQWGFDQWTLGFNQHINFKQQKLEFNQQTRIFKSQTRCFLDTEVGLQPVQTTDSWLVVSNIFHVPQFAKDGH